MIRYEMRSSTGCAVICEVVGSVERNVRHVDIPPDAELWRVNLIGEVDRFGKGCLVETGSWPLLPETRAEARFA
jgi:hypothetical protein